MSILTQLRAQARYNVLTPVFMLSLGIASPALAVNADRVVTAPAMNVELDENDSLTNRSTITGPAAPAVYAAERVRFINNEAGSSITSANYFAVALAKGADTFTNAGTIHSDNNQGVYVLNGAPINSFTNTSTGIISAELRAVEILTDVGSFINAGEITSEVNSGVSISGTVDRFENSGTITAGDIGVFIGGKVTDFTNTATGTISGDNSGIHFSETVTNFASYGDITGHGTGVVFSKNVTNFTNNGDITGEDGDGVDFLTSVDHFTNSGAIDGEGTGVYVNSMSGELGSFVNIGMISGGVSGVQIAGDVNEFRNQGGSDAIITGALAGVYVAGHVTAFYNDGSIDSANGNGLGVSGRIELLENRGEILSDGDATKSGIDAGSVGTIRNGGTIASALGYGIHVSGSADEVINLDVGGLSGIVGQTGIYVGEDLGYLENNAIIRGDNVAVEVVRNLTTVTNNTYISGRSAAIKVTGNIETLNNNGDINSDEGYGVFVDGHVTSFTNTDTIKSYLNAVFAYDYITSFINTGEIFSISTSGVVTNGNISFFDNSNLISSDNTGVYIFGQATAFVNSGTIEGDKGIYVGLGGSHITNSGLIKGTSGYAIEFSGDDNELAILTGARFEGLVDFREGANSFLNAENFHGSIYIQVAANSLVDGNVIAGNNYYYQEPDYVLIVDGGFVTQASQPVENLVGGLGELITTKLAMGDSIRNPDDLVSGYMAQPRSEAEMATRDALAGGAAGTTYWADAIGGAGRNAGAESGDVYGAMIAGGHTELAADLTLGVFGGVARTRLDIANGSHTIDGTVGLLGVYGEYDLGTIRTDFSLVGGLSGNDSHRTFSEGMDTETVSASYGGWFIAPTVGAYIPVLTTDTAEVSVGGKLGYLAGGFGGYTEDGTDGLTVGAQSYGVFTALLEVRGENAVSDTVTINGSLGVFAQNRSGSDVAVSFADDATPLIGPGITGGSGVGVKAGIGAEVAVSDALNVTAGVTGNWRSGGTIAASANLGIGGKF